MLTRIMFGISKEILQVNDSVKHFKCVTMRMLMTETSKLKYTMEINWIVRIKSNSVQKIRSSNSEYNTWPVKIDNIPSRNSLKASIKCQANSQPITVNGRKTNELFTNSWTISTGISFKKTWITKIVCGTITELTIKQYENTTGTPNYRKDAGGSTHQTTLASEHLAPGIAVYRGPV